VNGDSKIDLVSASYADDDVSVLLGNGDGTFQSGERHAAGHGPHSIATADVNGDGNVDVVTANYLSDDVSVLLGRGEGMFQEQVRFSAGVDPSYVAAVDLNGDGKMDLATANRGPYEVSILLNISAAHGCRGQIPGDANQDGKLDLSDAIWVFGHLFLGRPGQVKLACEGGTASNPGPGDLALTDVNGDGRIDISDPVSILSFLFHGTRPPALGTECVWIAGCPDVCQ
jgi:hypothetical protein